MRDDKREIEEMAQNDHIQGIGWRRDWAQGNYAWSYLFVNQCRETLAPNSMERQIYGKE